MTKTEKYVEKHLQYEYDIVKKNHPIILSKLSIAEQTLIYKYTEDGYGPVNSILRRSGGKDNTEYGNLLIKALNKLPDFKDLVYRCVDFTGNELEKYIQAEANNSILVEHTFVSASKSKNIAYMFGRNCQFRIFSRTAKEIERFAKYGAYHAQNEKEVLFKPNCKFKVIQITKNISETLITMEEII